MERLFLFKLTFFLFTLMIGITDAQQQYSSTVQVKNIDKLLKSKTLYNFPDIINPRIIMETGDTIDISDLVIISNRNKELIYESINHPDRFKHFVEVIGIQNYIVINDYVVCLSEQIVGKDILLWKKQESKYHLIAIYPSEIGVCLYCDPDFQTIQADTFSIGTIQKETGNVYGGYGYYIIEEDTLRLVRRVVASGRSSFIEAGRPGNPINGATCVGYLNIVYSENGEETHLPIYYECYDENGNEIYARAVDDYISLFKMHWKGVGRFLKKVKSENYEYKVGLRVLSRGQPYIAIEHRGDWYWTLYEEIEIQK